MEATQVSSRKIKSPAKLSRLSTKQRRQYVFLQEGEDVVELWWKPPKEFVTLDVPKFATSQCLGSVIGIIDCEFDDDVELDEDQRAESATYELNLDPVNELEICAFFGFKRGSDITFDIGVEKMWEVEGGETLAATYEMYSFLAEGWWGLGAARFDRSCGFGGIALDWVRRCKRSSVERLESAGVENTLVIYDEAEVVKYWFAVLARKLFCGRFKKTFLHWRMV